MTLTDDLSAPSDKDVQFRMKVPFPLLPYALGKVSAYLPVIMPERIASSPIGKPLTEIVGSGPFRYVANERLWGFARCSNASPATCPGPMARRPSPRVRNSPIWTASSGRSFPTTPRPRVPCRPARSIGGNGRWSICCRRSGGTGRSRWDMIDRTGFMGMVRFNHLQPPFNNPAIRRAALGAINQTDLVIAEAGSDPSAWNDKVGVFCPESPMANDAGLDVLTSKRDYARVKQQLAAAGYDGGKVVFLTATNNQSTKHDLRGDGGPAAPGRPEHRPVARWISAPGLARQNNRGTAEQGGWHATAMFLPGTDLWDPAGHLAIRGNGLAAWSGWPTSPRLEQLRTNWFAAPDLRHDSKANLCRDIQMQVWQDVPYIPVGRWRQPTAYRTGITGVLRGVPLFYNVKLQRS